MLASKILKNIHEKGNNSHREIQFYKRNTTRTLSFHKHNTNLNKTTVTTYITGKG